MKNLIEFSNVIYEMNKKKFSISKLKINQEQGLVRIHAPNGYGKTMLLNFMLDIYKPSSGKFVSNIDSKKLILINDSYMGLSNISLENNASYLIKELYKVDFNLERNKVFKSLELENLCSQIYQNCSKGTQQKLNIMPLFYDQITQSCNLIILDEVFLGLDQVTTCKLIEKIQILLKRNITVIIVEHNIDIFKKIVSKSENYYEITINEKGEYYENVKDIRIKSI